MRRGRGRGGRGAARSAGGSTQDGKRQPRIKATGKGLVKAVLSGDTLVLSGVQKPGEPYPPEREVTLSGILAPKFARNKNQQDQPWAWHSREFLRKKILGRPVSFELVYRHEGKEGRSRDYCNVKLEETNLANLMVSSGWATVQPVEKDKKIHPEKAALLELEKKANEAHLGVHNNQVSPADKQRFFPTVNAVELLEKFRNTPLPGIVDKVLDGSNIRVELLGDDSDPLKHYVFPLRLAGVECIQTPVPTGAIQQPEQKKHSGPPKWKKAPAPTDEEADEEADDEGDEEQDFGGPAPKPEKPQPFSIEAQKYVEARLLHRDVKVLLQGADGNHPQANLFGTLQFEKGNITEKLLEQGLGKYVKWTASLTGNSEKLAALEGEAKNRRLNLWQKWSPAKEAASDEKSGPREFNAKVTQVLSGDRIAVELEDAKDPSAESGGEEKRYSLASIRCPRLGSRGGPNEDWALDAREWLRKRIHGKKVRVVIEYEREPLPEALDPTKQQFVSLYINKQNVNEGLVEAGLARLAPHRRNEDRASNWDRLLSAEHKAQKGKVGVHGSSRPPLSAALIDLTGFGGRGRGRGRGGRGGGGRGRGRGRDEEKKDYYQPVGQRQEEEETKESGGGGGGGGQSRARVFLSALQKTQRQPALVEYVFSGSRFKLWVQGQNLICFFVLAGIRSPRNDHDGSPNEWTHKATDFVRQRILQKTVHIDTEEVDRNEVNFVGTIFYNNGQNLSVELLREGLASIFEPALRNSSQREALEAAQKTAKEGKVGLWKNWVEPPPEEEYEENYEEEQDEQPEEDPAESLRLKQGAETKIRVTEIVDACTFYSHIVDDPNVALVQDHMKNFTDEKTVVEDDVKSGKVFAGIFGNEGTWHRVRIEAKTTQDKQYRALFIDYGNREVLELENLRALDEELARLPPTAHQMYLAVLKAPGDGSEYFEPAGQAFSDLVWDRDMVAKVELVDQGKYHVTLKRPGSETTVNQYLLENAWVRVQPRPHRRLKDLGRGAGYTPLYKSMLEFEEVGRNTRKHIWEYGNVSDEEEDTRDDRGRVPSKKAKEKELKDKEEKRKAQADKERKLAERPRKADKGGGGGKGGKGGAAAAGGDKGKGGDKGGKKK